MKSHPIIDYESTVSSYIENLSVTLRGFVAAEGLTFLETWVPDDDPMPSILGIFEAAKQAGLAGVTVRVERETLESLDLNLLASRATAWGEPQFDTKPERSALTVSFGIEDPLEAVNPLYSSALKAVNGSRAYEGVLVAESGLVLAISTYEHLKLMALVKVEDHIIRCARHSGTSNEVSRRLMELLCPILEGKPVLEASDHAVLELEFATRDHTRPVPAPGVVMVENCDPMFTVALRLVRDLLSDYRRQTGFSATENFYVRPCSLRWRSLTPEARLVEIAHSVAGFPGGSEIQVISVEGDRRVVVQIAPGVVKDRIGAALLGLERHLQQMVEPVLQVHLPAKSDLNTIRRIKDVRR